MKAVILAAGKGTRMKELTRELPKPMLEVEGKPILQHIVEGVASAGVEEICIITGWQAETIEDFFGDGSRFDVRVEYARQAVQDGTGKAPELAKGFVDGDDFLLTYGDILVKPETYAAMCEKFADGSFEGLLTVTGSEDVTQGGLMFFDDDFLLNRLVEKPLPEQVEELRLDLWRTGFFGDIEVLEQKHLDREPPVVDFRVRLSPRNQITHQFSVGYGTDTLFRTQYHWTRHLLSDRGDSLRLGAGWRQQDSELQATGEYRLPRRTSSLQFWLANGILRRETQEFVLKDDNDQEVLRIARGEIFDTQLRLGRLRLHNNPWSNRRIQSTFFVDLLRERDNFNQALNEAAPQPAGDFLDDLFGSTDHTVAVGVDLDWPVIRGAGFMTTGHHERAWALTANEAWGSEKSFSQVYLSSRWNLLLGHRWKILLRGEIGWSDADLKPFYVSDEDGASTLLVTELPYRYSFRAGGSQSVRGYAYNDLSTNGIGSNHLLTGSAELEFLALEHWSVAAFFDIGNAFNHWSDPRLKRGAGVGIRWYSMLGAVRLDAAQGLDIPGKPWEIYLTIGTPLL